MINIGYRNEWVLQHKNCEWRIEGRKVRSLDFREGDEVSVTFADGETALMTVGYIAHRIERREL